MEKYLNTPIKEVISKFPALAQALKKYDINCATCNGNCITKNIFEEHNLSMKDEMQLVAEMTEVIRSCEN